MGKIKSIAEPKERYRRPIPLLDERDRVLIVTEGLKTEPDYFRRLVDEFDLTTADVVRIVGDGGSAPISVFEKAKSIVDSDEDYEHIFCVFDRDQHESYGRALEKIAQLASKKKFLGKTVMAITSIPCFEFWFILHVIESTKSYDSASKLIADLRKIELFKKYNKKDCADFFDKISGMRNDAKKRAERILEDAKKTSQTEYYEEPSTRVHMVVGALEKISVTTQVKLVSVRKPSILLISKNKGANQFCDLI